jgi:hypothetical protein
MKNLVYNEIEVGEVLGPYEHSLTEKLVQRYCFGVDTTYPWEISEDSTHIPIIPPTMIGNLSFRLLETQFYRQPGTIHASQEMIFFHPIRRDCKLFSKGKMIDKYVKRGRQRVDYEVYFSDEKDQPLAYSRLTEVLPGAVKEPDSEKKESGVAQSEVRSQDTESRTERLQTPLGPITRKVTQEKMTAYSEEGQTTKRGISIHVHEEVARKAGFKGTIAQGLMSADYISEMMAQTYGPGWIRGGKLSLKFIASVYAGDEVTAKGIVQKQIQEEGTQRAIVEVWCENQTGQKVTVGTASALILK